MKKYSISKLMVKKKNETKKRRRNWKIKNIENNIENKSKNNNFIFGDKYEFEIINKNKIINTNNNNIKKLNCIEVNEIEKGDSLKK